jgi:hypothetical protein
MHHHLKKENVRVPSQLGYLIKTQLIIAVITSHLAAVGFPTTGLTRWRRHHWHHRAYKLCRLALGLARRSGGGAPTPAWMVTIPESAPLAEEMAVCHDRRQTGGRRPWQDVGGALQQMIREVVRTASALGTVVVVEWRQRHSERVFAPPLATTTATTLCNVDVMSTFWENVSSMRVSTTTGDILLPLLRCEALGIHHRHRLLGPIRPGRDVSVLLKEFEEDFGDGEEEEYAHEIALYMLKLEVSCVSLSLWIKSVPYVARRLNACLGRTCRA